MFKVFLFFAFLVYNTTDASVVTELTNANFDRLVKNSGDLWIVEFYSPTCPYCRDFAPEYEEVAASLDGSNIKVGRIDGVSNDDVTGKYNIKGYPTVLMFKPGNGVPENYNGPRKSTHIINTAKALLHDKKIRSFGEDYAFLPQTRRIPKPKTRQIQERH